MALLTRFPTADSVYSGIGFTNPTNAYAGPDGVYATHQNNVLKTVYSYKWYAYDFSVIPDTATINTVTLQFVGYASLNNNNVYATTVHVNGVEKAALANGALTTTPTEYNRDITVGGWTKAELMGLEVIFHTQGFNFANQPTYLDYISVIVGLTDTVAPAIPSSVELSVVMNSD